MKYLVAALVTITLIVASIISDMGYMSEHDGQVWDKSGTIGIGLFVLLILWGGGDNRG